MLLASALLTLLNFGRAVRQWLYGLVIVLSVYWLVTPPARRAPIKLTPLPRQEPPPMTLFEIDLATAAGYQLVCTDSGAFAWCRQVHPAGALPMPFGARDARALLEGIERHELEYHPVPYVPVPWRNPRFHWGVNPDLGADAPHYGPCQLVTGLKAGDLVATDVNHFAITRMEDLSGHARTLTRWVTVSAAEDWPTRQHPYVVIPFLGYPEHLHPDPRKRRALAHLMNQPTAEQQPIRRS